MNKIPFQFELEVIGDMEEITSTISKARVRVFYKGKNRNFGYISPEFAEKLIKQFPYLPIVGIFDEDKQDFTSHKADRSLANMYGLVPENPNGKWETFLDSDNVERTYYAVDVYLYTKRWPEAKQIVGNPQSFELDKDTIKGSWKRIEPTDLNEYFVYTEATFVGLMVLGKSVEPCFEGAAFYELQNKIAEILQQAELAREEKKQKGGKQMSFKFSNDEKTEKIWKAVNPDFSLDADKEFVLSNSVCSFSEKTIIVSNSKGYEAIDYSLSEEGNIVLGERRDIAMKDYSLDEFEKVSELEKNIGAPSVISATLVTKDEKIAADSASLSEKDNKIVELETEKTTLLAEAAKANDTLKEVQANFSALQTEKQEKEMADKKEMLSAYSEMVDEKTMTTLTENLANFDLVSLEKELLFASKNEHPDNFFKDGKKVPASFQRTAGGDTGIASVLAEYMN